MTQVLSRDSRVPDEKRIVFLGDSITNEGTYMAFMDAYFQEHMPDKRLTFINLGVSSETASGLSEEDHGFPRPCIHERINRALMESKPDWVVVCYGMNDGIYHPFAEERFKAYQDGILKAIGKIHKAGAKAIVMTPPPFDPASKADAHFLEDGQEGYSYMYPYAHYNEVLRRYSAWLLTLNDKVEGIVNIHDPLLYNIEQRRLLNPAYSSGDGIHPNALGHWVIATALMKSLFNITLERIPEYVENPAQSELFTLILERHTLLGSAWKEHVGHSNPAKADALPLDQALLRGEQITKQIQEESAQNENRYKRKTSMWKGYHRLDFYLSGREAILIEPKEYAEGRPWIWRAEFFDDFPAADMALLEQGWAIAYYRISHMYGCPYATELMHQFQSYIVPAYALAAKAVIFGFSRGGLYAFNYAAAYPQSVAVLYLDAPVLDIRSWPGGKGVGTGAALEWEECLAIYGLTDEQSDDFKHSPLDQIDKVLAFDIPLIIVAGDADEDVPFTENAARLVERYRLAQGRVKLIVKPGIGHHPHSLEDPQPIVDYIKSCC